MEDPTEIGKYGTVKLLKRREPSTVVASYPIDEEEVTFGRDRSCSVRLYYQWVSSIHCKIVFEERKAFLQIFGSNGVIVDGCPVFPTDGSGAMHATVPLPNGSTFEIHKKLFMFNYPPKELRPQLFTPAPEAKRRKNVRMSMVQSAHVFSPAPSPNPRDNLRVLQSPLKISSLAEDEPVTLVDGNNPVVFQEEQDLIILEDVDPENIVPLNQLPTLPQLPPQTPRRKSIPSLHRAVLIRSAQRVQQMRELQAQRQWAVAQMETHAEVINVDDDSAEEEEVEEAISDDLIIPDGEEEMDEDEDEDEDGDEQGEGHFEERDDIVNYETFDVMDDEQDITEAREEYEEEVAQPFQASTPQASSARPLGKFMTPQLKLDHIVKEEEDLKFKQGPMRPPPGYRFSMGPGIATVQPQCGPEDSTFETELVQEKSRAHSPSKPRQEVSEEERKAIIERRKSNVRAPDVDFAEHAPGLRGGRTSLAPNSPTKPASPFKSIRATIDDGEDTRSVLQRLEESLEDMRKKSQSRQSIGLGKAAGLPPSPEKAGFSLLAKGVGMTTNLNKAKTVKRDLRMPSYGRDMSAIIKSGGSQMMKDESDEREGEMEIDSVSDDEKPKDSQIGDAVTAPSDSPSKEAKAARRARRSEIVPVTPRMDGLKDMFRPTKDNKGLETPYVLGMRNLFCEKVSTNVANTPKLDGMRSLFNERRIPDTPVYDGIVEIMPDNVVEDVIPREEKVMDAVDEVEQEVHADEEMETAPEPRNTSHGNPRTVARSKGRIVRGTPTDLSTMADDEMTPDMFAGPSPKKRGGKGAAALLEEGAIVHKTTRGRKPASKRVTENNEEDEPDTRKPVSRQRLVAQNTEDNETDTSNSKSRTRSKTQKHEASAVSTDVTGPEDSLVPAKPSRRTRTVSASTAAATNSEDERLAGRVTRARSQSAEPDGEVSNAEDDAMASVGARYKRSTRAKVQAVETIPEEEDAPPAKAAPEKRLRTVATTSRSRKVKPQVIMSETEETVPAPVAAPASATKRKPSSRTRTTTKESTHASRRDTLTADKENTPERSPDSSKVNVSNNEGRTAVAPTKAKTKAAGTRQQRNVSASAKTSNAVASKLPTSKSSAARRNLKAAATTDSEESAAPKVARTRARK